MMDSLPDIYPLTSLQIGDIQSSRSQAFIYFASSSKRFLILVDNRPWSSNIHPISTQLWQLMVTKYRMSPFINTRTLANSERNDNQPSSSGKFGKSSKWSSVIDAAEWQKKLSKALHGFIVFDVSWRDVRGIQYLNELQTDTSLALEVKHVRKWEFTDVKEAINQMPLWFSGIEPEKESLTHNLNKLYFLNISNFISPTSSPFKDLPEDMFYDAHESSSHTTSEKTRREDVPITIPIRYQDTLLRLRFNDSVLPFKLRNILMSDLGLLRMLESGLPTWVIFLQSYPLFCFLYRPWMRHLARTLYILISLSTFVIAFYDLYKNVPLLKATVASLCGPCFDWIDKWDMISRLQYLGTMLFLQNFEKAVQWFVVMVITIRPVLVVITKPLLGSLTAFAELITPLWNACGKIRKLLLSVVWLVTQSLYELYLGFIGVLYCPFHFLYTCVAEIVSSIHPIFSIILDLVVLPLRFIFALVEYAFSVLFNVFILIRDIWHTITTVMPVLYFSWATEGADHVSISRVIWDDLLLIWRKLWNDIFRQVFGAIRCIINVISAIFDACNRHRLSILAMIRRLDYDLCYTPHRCHCDKMNRNDSKDDFRECDFCK